MTTPASAAPTDTANTVAEIVRTVMAESRPALLAAALTGRSGESENLRHEEVEFLRKGDLAEDQLSIDKLEGEAPILSKSKDLGDSSLRH